MASVNKCIFVGRLTRDVEVRTFADGGKVSNFGLAINKRFKNRQTGKYDAVFINCAAFNRNNFKLADIAEQYLKKGDLVYIEAEFVLDEWQDRQTGQKRTAPKFNVDSLQMLGSPNKNSGQSESRQPSSRSELPQEDSLPFEEGKTPGGYMPGSAADPMDSDIPF